MYYYQINSKNGSPGWSRSNDIRINSAALCQLSYRGIKNCAGFIVILFGHPPAYSKSVGSYHNSELTYQLPLTKV